VGLDLGQHLVRDWLLGVQHVQLGQRDHNVLDPLRLQLQNRLQDTDLLAIKPLVLVQVDDSPQIPPGKPFLLMLAKHHVEHLADRIGKGGSDKDQEVDEWHAPVCYAQLVGPSADGLGQDLPDDHHDSRGEDDRQPLWHDLVHHDRQGLHGQRV
jgi:hypothetical protein